MTEETKAAEPRRLGILCEPTPNPAVLKFKFDDKLNCSRNGNFPNAEAATGRSILAEALFAHEHVKAVFITPEWLSITKSDDAEWHKLAHELAVTIRTHYSSGDKTVEEGYQPVEADPSEIESKIKGVLDEIRPMVQMDGGDIVFAGYDNGIVRLHMQGACSGCPSSTMTLKMGIQRRLQEVLPEVVEVQPV